MSVSLEIVVRSNMAQKGTITVEKSGEVFYTDVYKRQPLTNSFSKLSTLLLRE